MSRREIGELKAFITSKVDEVRAPYARTAQKLPRRTLFCGSANNKQFLSDETGSRRFWVIPITRADYQHTVNMQQAWAQAYHLYLAGEPYYLNDDEIKAVTDANDQHFQALCPIAEALEANYRWDDPRETWKNFLTTTEALTFCFSDPNYRPNQSEMKKAGTFLTKRCGARKGRKEKGQSVYGYWMPDRYSKHL